MELLIVIIVIAVLASIALPKFVNSGTRSKEAALRANLKIVREAIQRFRNDTSLYPTGLEDLAADEDPGKGLTSDGTKVSIQANTWHGPYLMQVPKDPITAGSLFYATASLTLGTVKSNASGNDTNGVAYSTY